MKAFLRTIKFCALLLSVAVVAASAQQPPSLPDPWLVRAQTITGELLNDTADLDRFDRALLLARLGEAWWKDDRERARAWLLAAVEEVKKTPDFEEAAARRQRRAAARALLSIITPLDRELSARLTAVFMPKQGSAATEGTGAEDATALVDAALEVANSDPKLALELGTASLRAGSSYRLAGLLARLRSRERQMGDALFDLTLATAQKMYDRTLLNALVPVAFRGPAPSEEQRRRLLTVLAKGVLRPPGPGGEETANCELTTLVAPLLSHFDRLLPQQAPFVRQKVGQCQSVLSPSSRRVVNEALRDEPLNTVEGLLKAGREAADVKSSGEYQVRAAYLAAEGGDFERAVEILDAMSSDERRATQELWDKARWSFAVPVALAHLKRQDRLMTEKVIEAIPAHLRAYMLISIVDELVSSGDSAGATQFLYRARGELPRTDEADQGIWQLVLVRKYARLVPNEAPLVLAEAVKALNSFEPSVISALRRPDEPQAQVLVKGLLLDSFDLPASLLKTDEVAVSQAIASVEQPAIRSALRLKLLYSVLGELRREVRTTTPSGG